MGRSRRWPIAIRELGSGISPSFWPPVFLRLHRRQQFAAGPSRYEPEPLATLDAAVRKARAIKNRAGQEVQPARPKWDDHEKEHPSAVHQRFGGMWMTTMITLDDTELEQVMSAARPLPPKLRGEFLQAVAAEIEQQQQRGPGADLSGLSRIAAQVFRSALHLYASMG